MKLLVRITFSIFIMHFLASCAWLQGRSTVTPVRVNEDGAFLQTGLYMGGCIAKFKDEGESFASIAGAVVPQLISKGLDSIGATLRKAGEEDVVALSALHNLDGKDPACLQLVHGVIAPTKAGFKTGQLSVQGAEGIVTDNLLQAQKIYLADKPRLFIEMRLLGSKDGSGMALAVSYISYDAYVRGSKKGKTAGRSISTEIIFHGSGVATDDKTAIKAQLFLGEFSPGTQLLLIDADETGAQWIPLKTTPWFKNFRQVAAMATGKPVTVTAKVFETRSENKLLLTLADVFDGSKETLQEELEKGLLKSKKREAEISELTKEREVLEKHYTNLVAAEGEVLNYCASSNDATADAEKLRLEASKKARLAQLTANLDALAAGIPQPYKTEKLIKVSGGSVPGNCQDSRAE